MLRRRRNHTRFDANYEEKSADMPWPARYACNRCAKHTKIAARVSEGAELS